jgi:hypothetical protein
VALSFGVGSRLAAQHTRPRRATWNWSASTICRPEARISRSSTGREHRWIAYIGHHGGTALNPLTGRQESNGTSIVDVTNPRQPKYLAHIPGESGQGESGGAQMVRVCDGTQLPRADKSKVYLLRTAATPAMRSGTSPIRPSQRA